MRRLFVLVRTQYPLTDTCTRGPKKKGQTQAKIQSNDIVNIFKDRTDPQPKNITQYPIFVQQMSLGMRSIHQLLIANQHNIKYESPTKPLYKSYINGLKRQRYKSIREYKQLDWVSVDKSENIDIHDRTSIYDIFGKSQEEQAEEQKAAQAAEALEDDDEDQI